jgi:UDP-N-acetylmuramate--alanine ligase
VADGDLFAEVFVTNVGGAGMSAVATLLVEKGQVVSGHDPAAGTPFIGPLRALGVEVATGAEQPPLGGGVTAVVVSTATPDDAPVVVAARERGLPVLHRSEALAWLTGERTTVSVAGTHGKTTTSAMLATILDAAGTKPGWVVGAPIPGLGRSSAWGGDGPLVVEADESDGTFLRLATDVALVTNVEPDHLEHYGGFDRLVEAFRTFLAGAAQRVVCADDAVAAELGRAVGDDAVGAVSYGTSPEADVRIVAPVATGAGVTFRLEREGSGPVPVELRVHGMHNVRNATAAVVAATLVGVPLAEAAAALHDYVGVARRFEARGTAFGATLVDDYAHLPTEVAAAIDAGRELGARRLVAVFQPHRYSRTEALGRAFASAFAGADRLAVTDVYAAGEAPRPGVSGKLVVDAVLDAHPAAEVAYLPSLDDVVAWLRLTLRPGDVCLTLGAGDLTTVPTRLVELAAR